MVEPRAKMPRSVCWRSPCADGGRAAMQLGDAIKVMNDRLKPQLAGEQRRPASASGGIKRFTPARYGRFRDAAAAQNGAVISNCRFFQRTHFAIHQPDAAASANSRATGIGYADPCLFQLLKQYLLVIARKTLPLPVNSLPQLATLLAALQRSSTTSPAP